MLVTMVSLVRARTRFSSASPDRICPTATGDSSRAGTSKSTRNRVRTGSECANYDVRIGSRFQPNCIIIRSLWAPPMLLPGNMSNPASKLAIWRIPFCYNHHQRMRICESQSGTGCEVVGASFDDLPLRPTLKFNEHVERTRRYCFWSRGRLKQLMCGCRGLCELSSRKLLDS